MPRVTAEQMRRFGKSRSRHAILLENYAQLLDLTASCGWHLCNDQYYYHRDKGSELSDHYLLILTIHGCGSAVVDGQRYTLKENSLMIFPQNHPHTYMVPKGGIWEFYWIHIKGPGSSRILESIIGQHGLHLIVNSVTQVREQIEHLLHVEYLLPEYYYQSHVAINRIMVSILNALDHPNPVTSRRHQQVSDMISYLESHYQEDIQLQDLGQSSYMSVGHLIKLFKQETGMTPHRYLMEYRLREACTLLEESDLNVAEICAEVGYRSASTFIVQFKSVYHVTPLEYRNRCHRRE